MARKILLCLNIYLNYDTLEDLNYEIPTFTWDYDFHNNNIQKDKRLEIQFHQLNKH